MQWHAVIDVSLMKLFRVIKILIDNLMPLDRHVLAHFCISCIIYFCTLQLFNLSYILGYDASKCQFFYNIKPYLKILQFVNVKSIANLAILTLMITVIMIISAANKSPLSVYYCIV